MPERVLVVDDTPGALFLTRTLLTNKGGMTVMEAASGAEALQQIQATPPDLIILDYMMPDIDGPQLLMKIRRHPATAITPVIMLTARSDATAREQSIEAGADRFIVRPIKPMRLLDEIRELLDQAQTLPPDQS